MKKLNILVLQPDFSLYESAYYQHQFTEALGRVHRIFRYGPKLAGYETADTIEDVLKKCPFDPDLICFGAGWENENEAMPEYDPHPSMDVANVGIPSVMVLNKEYKKLEKKLEFIQANGIRKVFTVHHDHQKWQERLDVPFVHFPFAIDPELFRDFGERKRYALGFSGLLQVRYSDIRTRIKQKLFLRWPIKSPRYWFVKLFWWDGRRLPFVNKGIDNYARLLNRSKLWLSTPSPAELVGTRYYEIMASKALLFCSRSPVYEGLFEDRVHCVMFNSDLDDFDDVLFYYLDNNDERQAIANAGREHVLENHTWERRIEQFTDEVMRLL